MNPSQSNILVPTTLGRHFAKQGRLARRVLRRLAGGFAFFSFASTAFAWGNEGHEIVAKIANYYLTNMARASVSAILANDTSGLTATDMASEATWADRYRIRHRDTGNWHFVDTEIGNGDIDSACNGHPPLPVNTPASAGPSTNCVVDKVNQFMSELNSSQTTDNERILALQFLLHLVGDLHQPLHSSDNNDRGGNEKIASASGMASGKLHAYWDTSFVKLLGSDADAIATELIGNITTDQTSLWQSQTPRDWALEAFDLAKRDAYGRLPTPNSSGTYILSSSYVAAAKQDIALQLSRAGVRLAKLLNDANLQPPVLPGGDIRSPFGGSAEVWVNTSTGVYHCNGDIYYGNTRRGTYMSEDDAKAKGYRGVGGKTCAA